MVDTLFLALPGNAAMARSLAGLLDGETGNLALECWRDHTPVLVDDIVSTVRTMVETRAHSYMPRRVCDAIHRYTD